MSLGFRIPGAGSNAHVRRGRWPTEHPSFCDSDFALGFEFRWEVILSYSGRRADCALHGARFSAASPSSARNMGSESQVPDGQSTDAVGSKALCSGEAPAPGVSAMVIDLPLMLSSLVRIPHRKKPSFHALNNCYIEQLLMLCL